MYFLGFGTKLSNVLSVQERIKLLNEKENTIKNEEYKDELKDIKKIKTYIFQVKIYKINFNCR